jgi:hypothetical protein
MAARNVPIRSRFTYDTTTGPDPRSRDPDVIRTLHAEGAYLTPEQYDIMLAEADEEHESTASSGSAKALFEMWARKKGERLEDRIEKYMKAFSKRFNPDELSDAEIAELQEFGNLMNTPAFQNMPPAIQAQLLKSQTVGVHKTNKKSGDVVHIIKQVGYTLAWNAARAAALGPRAAATTLQNYPTLGGVGICAAGVAQWVATSMLYNFFYTAGGEMGHMVEQMPCNATGTMGGRRHRKTRKHRSKKAKRTVHRRR